MPIAETAVVNDLEEALTEISVFFIVHLIYMP